MASWATGLPITKVIIPTEMYPLLCLVDLDSTPTSILAKISSIKIPRSPNQISEYPNPNFNQGILKYAYFLLLFFANPLLVPDTYSVNFSVENRSSTSGKSGSNYRSSSKEYTSVARAARYLVREATILTSWALSSHQQTLLSPYCPSLHFGRAPHIQ